MLKAAHPGGLIPPILHPSPLNRENIGERTDRTARSWVAGSRGFLRASSRAHRRCRFVRRRSASAGEPRPVDPRVRILGSGLRPGRHSA